MDAPAKPKLLQRVIDAWKQEHDAAPESEFDAADMGTAYGLDCSLAPHDFDFDDDNGVGSPER